MKYNQPPIPHIKALWCAQEIESETMNKLIFRKYRSVQDIPGTNWLWIPSTVVMAKLASTAQAAQAKSKWSIYLPNPVTEKTWVWMLGSSQESLITQVENSQPWIQIQGNCGDQRGDRPGNFMCLCKGEVQNGKSHHSDLPNLPLGLCDLAHRTRISWQKLSGKTAQILSLTALSSPQEREGLWSLCLWINCSDTQIHNTTFQTIGMEEIYYPPGEFGLFTDNTL